MLQGDSEIEMRKTKEEFQIRELSFKKQKLQITSKIAKIHGRNFEISAAKNKNCQRAKNSEICVEQLKFPPKGEKNKKRKKINK